MKVLPTLLAASVFITYASYAADSAVVETTKTSAYILDEESQRLADTYARMLRYYEQRNFSSTRSVRVLMSNYPHHVEPILYAAFDRYPRHYRHIIKAAIDAEPAFTRDVISAALNLRVADPAEIVRIAVKTEPSYAEAIVGTVDEIDPAHLNEVIRVAVTTEPHTADGILRANKEAEVGKLESIIQAVLAAAPAVGGYLADTISDIIGSAEAEDSNQISQDQERQRAIKLLRSAYNAGGLTEEQLHAIAARHELSSQELESIINQ
ncbi:MAG: hypothetical protein B7X54_08405 [Idiomarina sp. 34-48-12]|nr:MAG: hypothetical protein B7X54_08405 [Idiomarina sp. 34-48-12]